MLDYRLWLGFYAGIMMLLSLILAGVAIHYPEKVMKGIELRDFVVIYSTGLFMGNTVVMMIAM